MHKAPCQANRRALRRTISWANCEGARSRRSAASRTGRLNDTRTSCSTSSVMVAEMNNPTDAGTNRIWGAALTLILLIAILNIVAKLIGHFSQVRSK